MPLQLEIKLLNEYNTYKNKEIIFRNPNYFLSKIFVNQ